MAFTPLAGSAGRIRIGSSSTGVAGITEWSIVSASEVFLVTNFESTAESFGPLAEENIPSNIVGYKATLVGWFDSDTGNTDTLFPIGTSVGIDYLYSKVGTLGFHNKPSIVSNYKRGPKLREAQSFTLELTITGPLGQPTAS